MPRRSGFNHFNRLYEDEEEDYGSEGNTISGSVFMQKLKGHPKMDRAFKLRFSIERVFKRQKSRHYYELMGVFGQFAFTKKTLKLFCRIFKQMKLRRVKVGVVRLKRKWYFGRVHDKQINKSRRFARKIEYAGGRDRERYQEQPNLYHHRKSKSIRYFEGDHERDNAFK